MSDFELGYCDVYRYLSKEMAEDLTRQEAAGRQHPIPFKLDSLDEAEDFVDAAEKAFKLQRTLEFSPLSSGELELVCIGARQWLTASTLLLSRFFRVGDCKFESLMALLWMEEGNITLRNGPSSLELLFRQVSTGMKYGGEGSAWQWVASGLSRNIDGRRPYDHVKPDGGRGFTAQDEPVVAAREAYNATKRRFETEYPNRDFVLLLKRALLPLCPEEVRDEVFSPNEAQRNELLDRARELNLDYAMLTLYPPNDRPLDLLDTLVIESLLKVAQDEREGIEKRKACVRQLATSMGRLRGAA